MAFTAFASVINDAVERWEQDEEPALDALVALDAEVRAALRANLRLAATP
jgi:hypothetical protein